VLYPIEHNGVWEFYKKAVASFWTVEEIDLSKDKAHWLQLAPGDQEFIKNTLAFFAASDGIVNENLAVRFMNEIDIVEVKCFYGFQIAMENIHSECYSLLIDTYIDDAVEKTRLFNALETIPIIQQKAAWCFKWMDDDQSKFIYRLVAFACVAGIFFSSSFCSIYWLKKRGVMPGLTFSNELISRDESLHTEFAVHLFHLHKTAADADAATITTMVSEAVELEKSFATHSLKNNLIGMNKDLMHQYVEFVGDRLLTQLGLAKVWHTKNPFDFMEMISLNAKTNFFENKTSQYSKAGVSNAMTGGATSCAAAAFQIVDDF
jgi:ribonucleotide reductase beta subunit family protein with ferritin-like domain